MGPRLRPPKGFLLDYGGTLVEELGTDARAGAVAVLARAAHRPPHATLEHVLERAERVTREVAARRDLTHVETPWPALTRLVYDFFGVRFNVPIAELELAFWKAAVTTRPMPGARAALDELHRRGLPVGVVCNASFGSHVIRHELATHDLAEHLAFVMVSAEYAVRKPNPLLFEVAAARLGVAPGDIWFVGDRLDTDVAGARAAGMTAVWFHPARGEQSRDADHSDDVDLAVASWAELVRCVDACGGARRSDR